MRFIASRFIGLLALLLLAAPFAFAHETEESHLELPPGVQKIQQYQSNLAASITFFLAFLAGIIGFLSPCSVAIFPAFFAFLFKERKRAVFLTIAFTFGMMISFVLLGVVAGFVGTFFNELKRQFATVSGILLIVFGIMLLLNKGFSFLTFKMDHPKKNKTFFSMTLLGFFFALGWTPCVGPIISGVFVLAASTGTVVAAAGMMFAYSVGVAVPLLLVAYFSDRIDLARFVQGKHYSFTLFGKTVHTHMYNIIGGALLIALGMLIWIFRGSQSITQFFNQYTPWTMGLLYIIQDALLASPLTGRMWNVIGLIVIVIILFFVARALKKRDKPAKFK